MKKGIITLALMLIGMTSLVAQTNVNKIDMLGSGDVIIRQGDTLVIESDDNPSLSSIKDGKLIMMGSNDYVVTLPELNELKMMGAGDVTCQGTLKGGTLNIMATGACDATLNVDYDSIFVNILGASDVNLKGRCHYLEVAISGVGDLNIDKLEIDEKVIKEGVSYSHSAPMDYKDYMNYMKDIIKDEIGEERGYHENRSLLYDAEWAGFEAGVNILTPGFGDWNSDLPRSLDLRQMRSWCFNINLFDAGIAFNREHSIGLFSGIGIGWNNYCFSNPMYFWKGDDGILHESPIVDEQGNPLSVDRSKIGLFYVQAPLMLEFRPFKQEMYIDLGVTGGIQLDSWQTIRFGKNPMGYAVLSEGDHAEVMAADDSKYMQHRDLCINRFKLDATLRIGSADNFGIFAKYALLPLFIEGKGLENYPIHPFCIGFGINF